jgi:putative hydrolase of the HAD superfamily
MADIASLVVESQWQAVAFDYFGTLTQAVRQGPIHDWMALRLGCDPDEWRALLRRTFYLRASGRLGEPLDALDRLATELGGRPGFDALLEVYAARVAAIGAEGPLRPEAVPVLSRLRELGVRTAVVSDCWFELPSLLPTLPVHPLLDAVVLSTEVGECKPDPAMYLTACARLGVSPRRCLYVGDGGSRELTGAGAVGMTAVRLAAPDLAAHLSYEPDLAFRGPAVRSLRRIPALLSRTPSHA